MWAMVIDEIGRLGLSCQRGLCRCCVDNDMVWSNLIQIIINHARSPSSKGQQVTSHSSWMC